MFLHINRLRISPTIKAWWGLAAERTRSMISKGKGYDTLNQAILAHGTCLFCRKKMEPQLPFYLGKKSLKLLGSRNEIDISFSLVNKSVKLKLFKIENIISVYFKCENSRHLDRIHIAILVNRNLTQNNIKIISETLSINQNKKIYECFINYEDNETRYSKYGSTVNKIGTDLLFHRNKEAFIHKLDTLFNLL